MTKVIIEGGEPIAIPDAIAQDDAAIIRAIAPYYPETAEAELARSVDAAGDVTIVVTPSGKSKGA